MAEGAEAASGTGGENAAAGELGGAAPADASSGDIGGILGGMGVIGGLEGLAGAMSTGGFSGAAMGADTGGGSAAPAEVASAGTGVGGIGSDATAGGLIGLADTSGLISGDFASLGLGAPQTGDLSGLAALGLPGGIGNDSNAAGLASATPSGMIGGDFASLSDAAVAAALAALGVGSAPTALADASGISPGSGQPGRGGDAPSGSIADAVSGGRGIGSDAAAAPGAIGVAPSGGFDFSDFAIQAPGVSATSGMTTSDAALDAFSDIANPVSTSASIGAGSGQPGRGGDAPSAVASAAPTSGAIAPGTGTLGGIGAPSSGLATLAADTMAPAPTTFADTTPTGERPSLAQMEQMGVFGTPPSVTSPAIPTPDISAFGGTDLSMAPPDPWLQLLRQIGSLKG